MSDAIRTRPRGNRTPRAEIRRRVKDLMPIIAKGFAFRDMRPLVDAETGWGAGVSNRTLHRYLGRAWALYFKPVAVARRVAENGKRYRLWKLQRKRATS